MMSNYPYQGANEQEYRRLLSMQAAYDAETFRHLDARGVTAGWSCLEVGAGAGSAALWLLGRAGENGRCVATDIDTSFLRLLDAPRLEIWEHDVSRDTLPIGAFDIVHARFVLDVVPNGTDALKRMVDAVRPGGWIMLEEFDSVTSVGYSLSAALDVSAFARIQKALDSLWKEQGFDGEFGRKVAFHLHQFGMSGIESVGHVFMRQGATSGVEPWRLSVERLRSQFVERGLASNQLIDEHQALLMNPEFFYFSPLRVITWARKPS